MAEKEEKQTEEQEKQEKKGKIFGDPIAEVM